MQGKVAVKSQSAMEYLMTYGWSILIIAVVLGTLYTLGVFSAFNLGPSTCVSSTGFLCQNPTINNAGALSFTFGYVGTAPLNITEIGCSSGSYFNSSKLSWSGISAMQLQSGGTTTVYLPCNGGSSTILGTPFSGTIWVQYNIGNNLNQIEQIGVIKGDATTQAQVRTSASASVSAPNGPEGLAYDPTNGDMYVGFGFGTPITLISGTSAVANIVGSSNSDGGMAYDPSNGDMYIENTGHSVYVISGTNTITSFSVGSTVQQQGIAYNPSNGDMYIADYQTATVSLVSATSIVANVAVDTFPRAIAYDPSNGEMYVVTNNQGKVDIISGTSEVGTITVQSSPQSIAYDPNDGYMYVTNTNSQTVSVISGTNVLTNIAIGSAIGSIAYDPNNGDMYVANSGGSTLTVISGTSIVATVTVGTSPTDIAYNPNNGDMYVTNLNSATVSVV